MSYAGLTFILF